MLASASQWRFITAIAFSILGTKHWVSNGAYHQAKHLLPVVSNFMLQINLWSDRLCSHDSCKHRAAIQQQVLEGLLATARARAL